MSSAVVTPGALRLSKGVWLFAPDALDVLLRVEPRPSPSPEGFFSRPVVARLEVKARASRAGSGPAGLEPRTGVPDRVRGHVVDVGAGFFVVDAGIPIVVAGVAAQVGDVIEIDVDIDAGVGCVIG